MPPGAHKRLLGEILRLLRALRQPEEVAVDARVVLAEEVITGVDVALPQPGHQEPVRRARPFGGITALSGPLRHVVGAVFFRTHRVFRLRSDRSQGIGSSNVD